jgi:hypothetical protein
MRVLLRKARTIGPGVTSITAFRVVWVATAATIIGLMSPPVAQAGFSTQLIPISAPVVGGNTGLSDIATNPAGDALVAWSEGGINEVGVKLCRIRPDGSLGAVLDITDGTTRAGDAHVAFAPNGRAIVAWIESAKFGDPQSVRARWVEPDDTLGEPITLRTGGASSEPGELDLTATADNGALAAWHNFKSMPFRIVEAQYVTASGAVSELILPTSGAGSTHVRAAANAAGGTLLAWRDSSVQAQAFSPTGAPGTLQTPAPGLVADPELATDGNEHFQLGYKRGSLPSSLEYRALAADGSFGPEQTLDPMTEEQISGLDIATNPFNRSLAAWNRVGPSQTVKARFIASNGTPEATTFSTPAGTGNSAIPSAGIGGLGGGAIAWLERPGPGDGDIWGRIFPPAEPPLAPVLLSTQSGEATAPQLDVASNEVGLLAWRERLEPENPESPIQVFARQILPPPSCPDASGTVVQGRPTRISLGCSGLQLLAPEIVAQPAHGGLGPPDAATQSVVYTPRPGYAGADSFTFKGVNPGGAGATRTATLKVGKDTVRPVVRKFRISSRRVEVAGASASKKARFRLRYSEVATATITIERRRQCAQGKGRCKKHRKVGTLRAKVPRISATVGLKTRFGGRKLSPGRYRATAVARDPAGNRSKPKRLRFSVIGR